MLTSTRTVSTPYAGVRPPPTRVGGHNGGFIGGAGRGAGGSVGSLSSFLARPQAFPGGTPFGGTAYMQGSASSFFQAQPVLQQQAPPQWGTPNRGFAPPPPAPHPMHAPTGMRSWGSQEPTPKRHSMGAPPPVPLPAFTPPQAPYPQTPQSYSYTPPGGAPQFAPQYPGGSGGMPPPMYPGGSPPPVYQGVSTPPVYPGGAPAPPVYPGGSPPPVYPGATPPVYRGVPPSPQQWPRAPSPSPQVRHSCKRM